MITLGAETFANFANFAQIRESLRREKFYIDRFAKVYASEIFEYFLFSPNLLAALDIALILVYWRKKSRRQCNMKTRSACIAILVLEKCLVLEKEA